MALGAGNFALAWSLCLFPLASEAAEPPKPVPTGDEKGFYATFGIGASQPESANGSIYRNRILNGQLYNSNTSLTLWPDPGITAETGVGYDFGPIRTELTYLYNNFAINNTVVSYQLQNFAGNSMTINKSTKFNANVNSNSLLFSTYLDIKTGSRFVPYIGGGIGSTSFQVSGFPRKHESLEVLGYQAKIGLSYLASCTTDLFVEGTYKGASPSQSNLVDSSSINNWGTRIGARLRFANRCGSRPISTPTAITKSPAIDPITE